MIRRAAAWLPALLLLAAVPTRADEVPAEPTPTRPEQRQLEQPPRYGSYYSRYEPTFYTGFAPRALDPRRVHLHVGRGNQIRITLVLSDAGIAAYARDLEARRDTYRRLVGEKRIVLTQNRGLEAFEASLEEADFDEFIAGEAGLSPEEQRERNLRLMEQLNPGRIFRIEIPEDVLIRRWLAGLRPEDRIAMSRERRLELLNAVLPTRLWLAETDAATPRELRELVKAAPSPETSGAGIPADFADAYFALLERVAPGRYPRRDGRLAFVEFTAIHPIGTFNDYTDYKGRKIPLYPTPGRRALTTHQRTQTVDHIPTVVVYSYSPWIPYMHVGEKLHNSFHTLWWRMRVAETGFLPDSWREAAAATREGAPHTHLWLLSRGPMSSGCTHLTTGHIGELRQVLPSDTQQLYEIDTFLNRSYDYDVFDIDGDLEPEVMGVAYFIAYSLRSKQPDRLRVRDERTVYYDWLYAGELELDGDGRGSFAGIHDGRFIERTAKKGGRYDRVPLYEADYEPERFQFYRLVDIPFARELRKVSADHPFGSTARPPAP